MLYWWCLNEKCNHVVTVRRCAWCTPWFAKSFCVIAINKNPEKTFDISHGICNNCSTVWKSQLVSYEQTNKNKVR